MVKMLGKETKTLGFGVLKPLNYTNENIYVIVAFFLVFSYTLVFLAMPFFQQNNLLNYDMAGMYFSSWYTSNYLFPSPIGWNPFHFLGFPQNQFYGPLYPYLTSILAVFTPVELAFKLVLVAALLLTPVSFFYFARSFGFTKNQSVTAMLLMFSLLFVFPRGDFGGNIHATFGVGFVAQALALPLFFFYFGALKRKIEQHEILLPSLLLSLVVLAHALTAVAALFIPLAFLIAKPNKKFLEYIAKHIALVFLLTAFWVVPALAKMDFVVVSQITGVTDNTLLLSSVLLITIIAALRKNSLIREACFFVFALTLFSFAGKELQLPVHFYRFTMLFLLMAPIAVLSIWRLENKIFHAGAILIMLLAVGTVTNLHPEGYSIIQKITPLPPLTDSRLLVLASPLQQTNQNEIPIGVTIQSMVHTVRGIFSESSLNSRYVFDLERELDSNNLNWGVITDDERIDELGEKAKELVPGQLERLGIEYVLTPTQPLDGWKVVEDEIFSVYLLDKNTQQLSKHPYTLYKANDTKIVEVLDAVPERVHKENWSEEVTDWFLSPRVSETVLVDEEVPKVKGQGNEKVEVVEHSPTMERVKFRVDSQTPVPVLIKISHYPNWKAYQNGKELHIYRASPHLMLVYAAGEVELKYEHALADLLGYAFTGIGILGIVVLSSRKNKSL